MFGNSMVSLIVVLVICVPLGAGALWLAGFFENNAKTKKVSQFYSNRWMTKSEVNTKYIYTTLTNIRTCKPKKASALVRFEAVGRDVQINFAPTDYHTIVLGTTGSGKTHGYVLPYVYALGHRGDKPNMVITDPKGEIYGFMAETLRRQGYDVQVFNLSEPTKSSRWNPFEQAWNMYQRAHNLEKELKKHVNVEPRSLNLRIISSQYPNEWYEFNKIAYPSYAMADMARKTLKQRLLSDAEADVKDICSAICPVTNEKDPSWEEAARDLIQGTALAMLEDSLNPNLGMTKEKFNFYNIFKILGTRDGGQEMFKTVKEYFAGRDKLSPATMLAQTVISNADKTMMNFFGVVTQKLSMFADKGICYITSGTDMQFENFAKKPTVFFLIIPDQIKVRHTLATLCVAQLYKNLVNIANSLGGALPWTTYFILDEFGNMPKLNDFSTIVTVARGRRIYLTLVLQDYKQLETIYGASDAITIRNNCNVQIFIGVNDKESREIFSNLLGDMTIEKETESISKSTGKAVKDDPNAGSKSINKDYVSRPLLPPNELLDLQPGTIFVYHFGFHPLRSKVSLFWQCAQNGLLRVYKENDTYVGDKYFDEAAVFYDISRRNSIVLNVKKNNNDFLDW
ncbi:MAG: type IV secretory system conjugative DNA transfer family protein [Christensenellaceae bacterium]|jgi:type IV secretory pathway TraG/TraD family ATPase VirD4|nr:type IV secretory system conjugative DNA transfer family protein [Christensenellaceae bacterium]